MKTKYTGVYVDAKGSFFYQVELGVDKATGKRLSKKGRKDQNGRRFKSAHAAYVELTRIKNEYLIQNGYSNYDMTYRQFMKDIYLPYYEAKVKHSTFLTRESALSIITNRFADSKMRDMTMDDAERFRLDLLNNFGFSQNYAALVYGMFRSSLTYAVKRNIIDSNTALLTDAIAKKKAIVPYWTKEDFEQVLTSFYLDDYYDHMSFVIVWLFFMTGLRVSEGLALQWSDVDLNKRKLRVHHNLEMHNQSDYTLNPYTKTDSGQRIITIDADTAEILAEWKKIQASNGVKGFIMSYDDQPLYRSTVARIIKRHAKAAGVHEIEAKGLRHSHVSYLINEFNADILVVSKRLGHSSPEITLKHYAHLWNRNDEVIAEQLSGNITINTANAPTIHFNGNQAVKMTG